MSLLILCTVFVVMITAVITVIMAVMTRGITFYAASTDNHQIIYAAANAEKWGRPSGMHKFAGGKASMKEFAVAALAVTQRLLKDRTGDYPLVVLCLVANALSAILLFLTAAHYWGIPAALIVFGLYTVSFWNQLIALWGGVVLVAQAVFFISVVFLQSAETSMGAIGLIWYFAAGLMTGFLLFSSASSRKYLIFSAAALLWSLRGWIQVLRAATDLFSSAGPAMLIVIAVILFSALYVRAAAQALIAAVYTRKAPDFLRWFIPLKEEKGLDHYQNLARQVSGGITKTAVVVSLYLAVNLALSRAYFYWAAHFCVFSGLGAAVLLLTYPDVLKNLKGYYLYSQYGKSVWRSRFYAYREYFQSIGKPIKDDMRGAGWTWVLKYFRLMAPVPIYFLVFLGMGGVLAAAQEGFHLKTAAAMLAVLVIGLSPILIGEFTKAVQVGRSYYPGFVGLLLCIGYSFFELEQIFSAGEKTLLWTVGGGMVVISLIWNGRVFFSDVFPSRMAAARFIETIRRLGIKEFYTYDTPYNDSFIRAIPSELQKDFQIQYIRSLNEVDKGYVAVPGTNPTSVVMYDYPAARRQSRKFDLDPRLNDLIESREIEKFAVASFKTLGTSRIWVHEGEVPSYRDLILKEITDEDRWRGRAWLLKWQREEHAETF